MARRARVEEARGSDKDTAVDLLAIAIVRIYKLDRKVESTSYLRWKSVGPQWNAEIVSRRLSCRSRREARPGETRKPPRFKH